MADATRLGAAAGRDVRDVVLEVERLEKRFPVRRSWSAVMRHPRIRETATALADVSFEVRRGEFFGLLGPNGAGKSTLFKILATLVTPDAGRAAVEGFDVVGDSARVRRVLVPVAAEERSLSWRLSARENLQSFAALYDLRGAAKWRRVDEVLEVTGLSDSGTKMVGQFSSGMRQRLLIARALLARPRLLLLDEPTRSLDPVSARRFREFLREEIVGQQGCTVLIATHSAEEVLDLCGRIAVLDRGVIRAAGTPDELAMKVAGARYRLLLSGAWRAALDELLRRSIVRDVALGPRDADGWWSVELTIPAGARGAAAVSAHLAGAGVDVAALEPVRLPLADLIERVAADGGRSRA